MLLSKQLPTCVLHHSVSVGKLRDCKVTLVLITDTHHLRELLSKSFQELICTLEQHSANNANKHRLGRNYRELLYSASDC